MICRLGDLKNKEVINIRNGCRLGFADDIEFDSCTARICRLIVYGKPRCFGLLGREEDFCISWSEIEIIGQDTILVSCDFSHTSKTGGGFFKNLLK